MIVSVIAVIVVIAVFWWLKLVGVTITGDAMCGIEEHTHSEKCYEAQLSCILDEVLYADETSEVSYHTHDEYCYDNLLICDKTEHIHNFDCYPDPEADVEAAEDWLASIEDVVLTEDAADNVYLIAKSQVGYTESERNFSYDDNLNKKGYTRYGEWYGNPYGDWNGLFVSFCLNYCGADLPHGIISATAESMRLACQRVGIYRDDAEYRPVSGSVVFFDRDSDGVADGVGILSHHSDGIISVIEGDVDDKVSSVTYNDLGFVMGYAQTERLSVSAEITEPEETAPAEDEPEDGVSRDLMLFDLRATNSNIIYTSDLAGELVDISISDLHDVPIENGGTVYIGETYMISLEFSEINKGNQWVQFRHNEDGYLTYQIPGNLICEPFTEWKPISAKTEDGAMYDVGEFFVTEDGMLLVRFHEGSAGINFLDMYSNVDFSVNLKATISDTLSGSSTEIQFNDKIKVDLNVDGGAAYTMEKTHSELHGDDHSIQYTIEVKGTHGVVKDFALTDEMWSTIHHVQPDSIVVTDLDGNLLNPQPIISPPTKGDGGFNMSGFPDFAVDEGFLIKYNSTLSTDVLLTDEVYIWNAVHATGKDSDGNDLPKYTDDEFHLQLNKLSKEGAQVVITDDNGEEISLVKWDVQVHKRNDNLQGTLIIDTLDKGLTSYYEGIDIYLVRYNQYGERMPDMVIPWDQVNIEGKSMSFTLPEGHAFHITYYTHHENLKEDQMANVANTVKAYINGNEETAGGVADVIGFLPKIKKSAEGSDGKYVYFTIETEVSATIKDWGHFFLSDYAASWDEANWQTYAYENIPQDLVITATTQSGETITFTHYVEGGPTENTYILVAPSLEGHYDTFDILFNTSTTNIKNSKWILDEDATITVTYKLPFDTRVGIVKDDKRDPVPRDDLTLGDILAMGHSVNNTAILNYTETIEVKDTVQYEYLPTITKNSLINNDGRIDYTVEFHTSVPNTQNDLGYLTHADMAYFTDTFDERLEYVDGTLTVTCYDPWNSERWLCKYVYNGPIDSNTINVKATDFVLSECNPEAEPAWSIQWWLSTLTDYRVYYQNSGGGKHVFSYTLKIKDEYLYSTEDVEYTFDNTAEVTWDDHGTSGPVTETVDYNTGLLDKQAVLKDTKLEFDIHINRHALDMLEGTDTIVVEDTMTGNLSVYWSTIKLMYEDPQGNWIDFDSPDSVYTYQVTFDTVHNRLTFTLPDSLHMRIDYTTLITDDGFVSLNNNVRVDGKANVTDVFDAIFRVEDHSGEAAGSNNRIALLKQDGLTYAPLPGATFLLYGPMGDPEATLPAGVQRYFETDSGETLGYIGSYTTGADGSVLVQTQYLTVGGPYAFIETVAPNGYKLLDKPAYFYFHETDPNGKIPTVTTIMAIENYNDVFVLPGTGGFGVQHLTVIGLTLTVTPILYSIIRRKRERRLTQSP